MGDDDEVREPEVLREHDVRDVNAWILRPRCCYVCGWRLRPGERKYHAADCAAKAKVWRQQWRRVAARNRAAASSGTAT